VIDLHAHSSASDGTMTPSELMRAASDAGLDVVALTDHDTTAGWDEAAAALPPGLALVRGAELSCTRAGVSLHLLAYLFDPAHLPLATRLAEVRDSRETRAQRMVALLADDGLPVTWDQVRRTARGTVGRPHVAQALVDAGLVSSVEAAFTPEWIATGGRYWAPKTEIDALEAVALVRAAGGVTVFAHAGASSRGKTVGDEVIEELAAAGLDGLEVDHPDHPPATRAHLSGMAAATGLLVTGSSDFHGDRKTARLGENVTHRGQYEQLVSRASGAVLQGAAT
jgi:predicted metal-dependent phosphoesterase TrpH